MWNPLVPQLVILLNLIVSVSGQCSTPVIRREIRQLSDAERTTFFNAVKTLYNNNAANSIYNNFTATHYNFRTQAHGVAAFLPWHRYFLDQYERALKRINPSIILPYWDWSRDSQAPERSTIFSNNFFGGNGAGSSRCVTSGAFAGWQVRIPNQRCLQRQFNGGSTIGSWYSPGMMENLLNTNRQSYDQFRRALEGSPHASPHVNIGGDMSQMYSTNDPLFFMHHAFIDLIWYEWQQRNPNLAATYGGGGATLSNNMIPFNTRVSTAMSTTTNGYCYRYNRWSGASQAASSAVAASNTQPARRSFDATEDNFPIVDEGVKFTRRQTNILAAITNFRSLPGYVNALERTRNDVLRFPEPIPEAHIQMNGLDVLQVRAIELENYKFTSRFNLLDRLTRQTGILNIIL